MPELKTCSGGFCARPICAKPDCAGADDGACPKGYTCFLIVDLSATDPCNDDAECAGQRVCRYLNEENPIRFCTCLTDTDCSEGQCISGACVTTSLCLPVLGLTCDEVRHALR